jgi:glutamine amidotransferase
MCELLGVSSLHPVTLEMSFNTLMQRAETVNPDGWGAVFYEQNDAYVFREPRPASNSKLANLLGQCGVESRLVLSHIRRATTGPIELRNTHPFTREIHGRLHSFAFNGDIPNVFDLDLTLDQYCPIGETDGEFAFCWLLEQLLSRVDNGGWKHTVSILKSVGEQLAAMGPANFLYTDSLRLYAFALKRRYPDGIRTPGLYYNTRNCNQEQNSIPCIGLTIQSDAIIEQKLTLAASVPLSDETWVPFKENEILVIENGQIINTA